MTRILPSTYIIGMILFSLIIFGGITIINSFYSTDSSFIDSQELENFNKTFNKYDKLQNETALIQSKIENTPNQFGDLGVLNSLISSSWNTLQYLGTSLSFLGDIFKGLYTFFGLPVWLGNSLLSIITISIGFAIFSAIFQREL